MLWKHPHIILFFFFTKSVCSKFVCLFSIYKTVSLPKILLLQLYIVYIFDHKSNIKKIIMQAFLKLLTIHRLVLQLTLHYL